MSGTDAENTRWVEVWAVNAGDHYAALQSAASDGPDTLKEFVHNVWTNATEDKHENGAYYQAREMSEADYDSVDWTEVAATLLSE
jgi:hypothetical protein